MVDDSHGGHKCVGSVQDPISISTILQLSRCLFEESGMTSPHRISEDVTDSIVLATGDNVPLLWKSQHRPFVSRLLSSALFEVIRGVIWSIPRDVPMDVAFRYIILVDDGADLVDAFSRYGVVVDVGVYLE